MARLFPPTAGSATWAAARGGGIAAPRIRARTVALATGCGRSEHVLVRGPLAGPSRGPGVALLGTRWLRDLLPPPPGSAHPPRPQDRASAGVVSRVRFCVDPAAMARGTVDRRRH